MICVGAVARETVNILNKGSNDAFVSLHPSNSEVTVEPAFARVSAGASVPLSVSFSSKMPGLFEESVTMEIRGGKTHSLGVRAQVEVPKLVLGGYSADNKYDFGKVYIGGERTLAVALSNSGSIHALPFLDFSGTGREFRVVIPPDMVDAFERTGESSIIGVRSMDGRNETPDTFSDDASIYRLSIGP